MNKALKLMIGPALTLLAAIVFLRKPTNLNELYQLIAVALVAVIVGMFLYRLGEIAQYMREVKNTIIFLKSIVESFSGLNVDEISGLMESKPRLLHEVLSHSYRDLLDSRDVDWDRYRMNLCHGMKDSKRDILILKKGLLFEHLDTLEKDENGRRDGVENYLECLRASNVERIVRLLIVPKGEEKMFEEQLRDTSRREKCQRLYGRSVQTYWVYETSLNRKLPSECALFDCEVVVSWFQKNQRLEVRKATPGSDLCAIHAEIMNNNSIYNKLSFPEDYR